MEKPFTCNSCKRFFSTISNYRRHIITFHAEKTKQYQCWHCPKAFARQENTRKHTFTQHNDQEKRTVEVTALNKKWKPNIFIPGPWTPPLEATTKDTIYKIEIPGGKIISQINLTKCRRRIKTNPYLALTPEEALFTIESNELSMIGTMNRVQLISDLSITPSSSTETVVQDEPTGLEQEHRPEAPRTYGVFATDRD